MSKKRVLLFSIIIVLITGFSFHFNADAKSRQAEGNAGALKYEAPQEREEFTLAQAETAFSDHGDFVEASEIHTERVVAAIFVLASAFFFCILLARKNGLFFLKEKKVIEKAGEDQEIGMKELASEL